MKLLLYAHDAWLNLISHKLRSFLALLGILVGTASVVAMVSGGQLAANEALKQFKTLGTDLLAFSLSESQKDAAKISGTQENLTLTQVTNLAKQNKNILSVAPYTQIYGSIQFHGEELNGSILGVTQDFAQVIHLDLEKGRYISTLDGYAFFCVIGHGLYEKIKKLTFSDPIGQQLRVGQEIFTIIGVAKSWPENSFVYANIDTAVMVPLLASTVLSKYATMNNIIIKLSPSSDIEEIKSSVTSYINQILVNKQIYFRSAKELITSMSNQSRILTIFLGLIGSISLIVGGIGVMNIMLVSVVERKREIGIRLAVGASPEEIRLLFLVEAVILAVIGGGLGVVVGIFVAYMIALFSHWQFVLFLLPPLIGFSVSVAIGIFFGFYPAHQASQLDPINTLRSE